MEFTLCHIDLESNYFWNLQRFAPQMSSIFGKKSENLLNSPQFYLEKYGNLLKNWQKISTTFLKSPQFLLQNNSGNPVSSFQNLYL